MDTYKECIKSTLPLLNDRQGRLFLADQFQMLGMSEIALLINITVADRNTISEGMKEIKENQEQDPASQNYLQIRNISGSTIERNASEAQVQEESQ